ncbi:type VI secretion system protein ImpK [Natronocella acetinitrilica]|uniref:Type VI secretion system protein ImpK n=1 Tax=Natronocella acetinitrilica TaxID=414046 RepID=A0AAE3G1Y9_9GAMM|nr:type IVB secretion system protein IcmH/DotU [Natronocella acetinitrilica]MCP1673922.1 type VI secretion system protein ImpK [Natronocella acetinitrilica]
MSDDRTPPGGGDRTIIRPTPGGRAGAGRPPPAAPPAAAPPPPMGGGGPQQSATAGSVQDIQAFGSRALNPLVEAAMPLLLLCCGLRGTREHPDVAGLHAEAVRQVQQFEAVAAERGVSQESAIAARYALCTFIDEVVMNTPWGAGSLWPGRSLLLTFHRDSAGGEKVFQMIERVLADREPRRDLVEFFYVCLALGLQGQYRVTEGGQAKLAEVRERLYARIRGWRDAPPDELSPTWRGVEDRRNRLVRTVPAWVCMVLVALIGSGAFFGFHSSLNSTAAPLSAQLNEVRRATFESPVGPAAIRGVTLADLVGAVDPDRIEVESLDGGRTRIILRGEVFASASTDVTDEFRGVLRRLGEAIQQVPGSVLVEGHSDDVPIRSARFRDNYDLSQQRAESAAAILREPLSDPDRVDYVGIGEDRPRFTPASDPANRPLNRRIEIIHRPQGGRS